MEDKVNCVYFFVLGLTLKYTYAVTLNDTLYMYKGSDTKDLYVTRCASRDLTNLTLSCAQDQVLTILYAYVWWDSRVTENYCSVTPLDQCGTYTQVVADLCNGRLHTCDLPPGSLQVELNSKGPYQETCGTPNIVKIKYRCLPLESESIMDICGHKVSSKLNQLGGYLVNPEFPQNVPDRARYCECSLRRSRGNIEKMTLGVRTVLTELQGDTIIDCQERLLVFAPNQLAFDQCSNIVDTNSVLYEGGLDVIPNNLSVILSRQPFPGSQKTGRILLSYTSTAPVDISCYTTDEPTPTTTITTSTASTTSTTSTTSHPSSTLDTASTTYTAIYTSGSFYTGAVVGGVLGAVTILLLIFAIIMTVCYCNLRRRIQSEKGWTFHGTRALSTATGPSVHSNGSTHPQPQSQPTTQIPLSSGHEANSPISPYNYDYVHFPQETSDTYSHLTRPEAQPQTGYTGLHTQGAAQSNADNRLANGMPDNAEEGYLRPVQNGDSHFVSDEYLHPVDNSTSKRTEDGYLYADNKGGTSHGYLDLVPDRAHYMNV